MKIKEDVLNVLKNAIFTEPSTVLLQGALDRKLYTDTNKVLDGIGLKWNKKLKCHISTEDITEKWYNMIDTGEWLDIKKELQYFPTPTNIVKDMCNLVYWKEGMKVLEPSCGSGQIAFNLPDMKLEIDCIEINKDMADKCNMSYPQNSNFYNIMNLDFMEFENNEYKYDVIIANPPFSKLQSIKHFNKMVELLKENGQLVCVLPMGDYDENSSIKLRQDFTKFIKDNNCKIEYLNEGDFKESGTMVKTMIVYYKKEMI